MLNHPHNSNNLIRNIIVCTNWKRVHPIKTRPIVILLFICCCCHCRSLHFPHCASFFFFRLILLTIGLVSFHFVFIFNTSAHHQLAIKSSTNDDKNISPFSDRRFAVASKIHVFFCFLSKMKTEKYVYL